MLGRDRSNRVLGGTATVDYIATVIMRIPSQKAGGNVQIVGGDRSIVKVALDSSSSPG